MKKLTLFVLIFVFPILMVAQEVQEVEVEVEEEQLSKDAIEAAGLKIDLLIQQAATIQAKANWFDREKRLLEQEQKDWQQARQALIAELTKMFKCENTYDLDKRQCTGG